MALVDLIDVTKKFGSNVVLDAVNFSVNDKERIAIIGKNGGGKSTLMKILCGIYEVDDGRVVTQNNINIQMLEQAPKFSENLSVKDVLRNEAKEIYDAIAEYGEILDQIANEPDD
ncbi:MAG: ABC-F family ATP-binding cassette domain-containing protein, partial [Campylobacter sp.]|nr:ABC-F family ATP-binding cassette domain-containing protein [Campylobacter sp.]